MQLLRKPILVTTAHGLLHKVLQFSSSSSAFSLFGFAHIVLNVHVLRSSPYIYLLFPQTAQILHTVESTHVIGLPNSQLRNNKICYLLKKTLSFCIYPTERRPANNVNRQRRHANGCIMRVLSLICEIQDGSDGHQQRTHSM